MENLNTLNTNTTQQQKHWLPLDYLKDLEERSSSLTASDIDHHAFMATQYEQYGSIDFKAYMHEVIFENMDDDDIIKKYCEYMQEHDPDNEPFDIDLLCDYIQGMEPEDILRLGYFANGLYSSDYLRFNGYGNIEGVSEYELLEEAKNDDDFLDWLIDNSDNDEVQAASDDKDIIIEGALYLVSEGF